MKAHEIKGKQIEKEEVRLFLISVCVHNIESTENPMESTKKLRNK